MSVSNETTEYTATHKLSSISVCSNIPGYVKPRCFVREVDMKADVCVAEFCSYLHEKADKAARLEAEKWEPTLDRVHQMV